MTTRKKKTTNRIAVYDLKLQIRFISKKSAEKARDLILKVLNKEMSEIPMQVLFGDDVDGFNEPS